ncbi:MAG: class I SAM-dependent methyltransferase [Calditrichaeota bacterium]|nr:MAG: class I SAM-dependent methyltransferase [Calditrichota bacterium]
MAVNTDRWHVAQTYEKDWWEDRINGIDLDYLQKYATQLKENVAPVLKITKVTKILEIGSGPAGVLTFLESDQKYAIEPLESFFTAIPKCAEIRDKNVEYTEGMGENLPYDDGKFDLIIIDNVLDHCQDVEKVFAEMNRVLSPAGVVYLRLNLYNFWGLFVRYMAELFQIDEGHPYSFTKKGLEKYYKKHGLKVRTKTSRGVVKTWLKQVISFKAKELVKALTFSTPDTVIYILQKA